MSAHADAWSIDERLPSTFGAGQALQEEILRQMEARGWSQTDVFAVRLALEEALANAIKHGNRHDAGKSVHLNCHISDERLEVQIADEGPGFDPNYVPDCTEDEQLEVPSGRGIMLMRAFMCRVEYNESGNRVRMEKRRA